MRNKAIQILNLTAAGALLALLAACSPSYVPTPDEVAQAYESSGMVPIPPYTRTIFSSNNF